MQNISSVPSRAGQPVCAPNPHFSIDTVANVAEPQPCDIVLRPYQRALVEEARARFQSGVSKLCLQLATGGGKTVIFTHIAARMIKRKRLVLILSHRQEISDQIGEALKRFGIDYATIVAGEDEDPSKLCQLASVATLVRRLQRERKRPSLVIVDEAHHAVAKTWKAILDEFQDAFVLGCTATPERLDGQGLDDVFDDLICGPDISELIRLKYLKKPVVYAPPRRPDLSKVRTKAGDYDAKQLARLMSSGKLIGDAAQHWLDIARGIPTICFCVTRNHSQLVAERFRAMGIRAAHVDGRTHPEERRRLVAALGNGELDVLCNCGLIAEGVDVPSIGSVIMLRPTQSTLMYLQQVGRALRPVEGQEVALILDHAGNSMMHGLPDDPRDWSLASTAEKKKPPKKLVRNPNTGELTRDPPEEVREIRLEKIDAETVIQQIERWGHAQRIAWARRAQTREELRDRLRLIATILGYLPGWAYYRFEELKDAIQGVAA